MRLPRGSTLLLLPLLASALSVSSKRDDELLLAAAAPDAALSHKDSNGLTNTLQQLPTTKSSIGTKDAPVDGLDGKPHAGPWVDASVSKKPAAVADDVDDSYKPVPTSVKRLQELSDDVLIPEKNDGVMDDLSHLAPKKGTTGTEGGVSAKNHIDKLAELRTGEKAEKRPDSPKEAAELPQSEQEMIVGGDALAPKDADTSGAQADKPKGASGLEKPLDLPDRPKDAAPHEDGSAASPLADTLSSESGNYRNTMPYTEGQKKKSPVAGTAAEVATGGEEAPEGLIQPLHSFILSFTMILFSEIGDKTFLVAALMAMRHDRMVVFSAAFSALIVMTVLSAVLGHALPTLLPRRFTSFLAAALFLVFGAKMLREGLAMPKDSGVGEEMKEVEAELEEKEHAARKTARRQSSLSPYMLEAGRGRVSSRAVATTLPAPPQSPPSSDDGRSPSPSGKKRTVTKAFAGLNNLLSLLLSPAWVQTFIMTFLGEWGDRSQIATIAMAAGQDYWWVTGGAISGHAICTSVAVIGGRALAGKVSLRVVTLGGAIAFLVFGVIYLLETIYSD